MNELQTHSIGCPYCGEIIEIDIDCSEFSQSYIEDCSVCCRPINIHVEIGFDHHIQLYVTHENE